MNTDYAHFLKGAVLDYRRLGLALKAVIAARGVTLQQVQDQTRISRASVSRACVGIEITTGPLLLLCIWADLNPFELLREQEPAHLTAPSCGDEGEYRVFHRLQGVKPVERARQLQSASRAGKRARVSHA